MKTYFIIIFAIIFIALIKFFCGCTSEIPPQKNITAEVFNFNKKPSEKKDNPVYLNAKKLNDDYKKSGGEHGLDDIRFNTKYRYRITPKSTFIWTTYIKYHPSDVVIADDNEHGIFNVLTNDIDRGVFSPVSYVFK